MEIIGVVTKLYKDKHYIELLHTETGTEIFMYKKNKTEEELIKTALKELERLIHKF